MKLVQRYPYSNLYHLKGRRFKSILGNAVLANRPYLTVDYDVPVIPPTPEVSEVNNLMRQYKIFEKDF